jgi:outer membrane lipopolysaccharide assembly protein LptE/RlpB
VREQQMGKSYFLVLVISTLLLQIGCGYKLVGRGQGLPRGLKRVFIPIFVNKTGEPQIEREITRTIRQEFMSDGRIKMVSRSRADAILTGEILSYVLTPLSFDTKDNVTEYRLNMTIHITLRDIKKKKIIFQESINADKEYLVTESIASSEIGKQEALRKASKDFALELLDLITESF